MQTKYNQVVQVTLNIDLAQSLVLSVKSRMCEIVHVYIKEGKYCSPLNNLDMSVVCRLKLSSVVRRRAFTTSRPHGTDFHCVPFVHIVYILTIGINIVTAVLFSVSVSQIQSYVIRQITFARRHGRRFRDTVTSFLPECTAMPKCAG